MSYIPLFLKLGGWEIALILVVVLLFFGAKRLPSLARSVGKSMREFKDATKEVRSEIEKSGDEKSA